MKENQMKRREFLGASAVRFNRCRGVGSTLELSIAADAVNMGKRRELFVDEYLVDARRRP